MYIAVIAVNGMAFQSDASFTVKGIAFKGTFCAEIIQRCHDFKSRAWRIGTIGGSVQQTTVICIVYQIIPFLRNGIRIKIRLAHFSQYFSGRRLYHHNSAPSVPESVVRRCLKRSIQRGDYRISHIFPVQKLIFHLVHKKLMGTQK